jgi:hypothetical protein
MPLSWNEIKDRALRFSREWAHNSSEDAETKSFWDGFFDVFGVSRRRVENFEKEVKKLDGRMVTSTCFLEGRAAGRYQQLTSLLTTAKTKPTRRKTHHPQIRYRQGR